MKRQIGIALGIVLGLFVILGGTKYWQISRAMAEREKMGAPTEAVTTAKVDVVDWKSRIKAVGSVAAVQGVMIAAEEPGKVVKVGFESGASVAAGDTLIELDTSVEEANLRGVEAVIDRSRRMLGRAEMLRSKNAMSEDSYDTARESLRKAVADADSIRGIIARKKIVAPFAGRTGIRMVNVGQYVAPGAPLVPLHAIDPLYANFSVPESQVARLAVGQPVTLHADAYPDTEFAGVLTTVNPNVDSGTRQIQVQATVPNADGRLKAGMYVVAEVELPQIDKFLTIPASSVRYAPYGDTVFLVEDMKDPKGKDYRGVREQIVRLGEKRGDQIAVLSGLTPGVEIVTSGVFKLRPGAGITVATTPEPSMDPAPKPADT